MSKSTAATTPVTVTYTYGSYAVYSGYAEALGAILTEHPGAAVGHDGDLLNGGDRTLVWADETAAAGDDGAHAIAAIQYA